MKLYLVISQICFFMFYSINVLNCLKVFLIRKRSFMINISFEDFKKIEIVFAKIKEVKDHPNADRLYVLRVDLGDEQRQLVAGIRCAYTKEELVGKRIMMVKNLEPAVIRGEESQGMILAVSDGETLSMLSPERDVALGSKAS